MLDMGPMHIIHRGFSQHQEKFILKKKLFKKKRQEVQTKKNIRVHKKNVKTKNQNLQTLKQTPHNNMKTHFKNTIKIDKYISKYHHISKKFNY